jgi:exonuclease III
VTLRIVTWNMNACFRSDEEHARAWAYLDGLGADVALVQEAKRPADRPEVLLSEIGGSRPWGTGIVPYRGLKLDPLPRVPLGQPVAGKIQDSHPGCSLTASISLGGEPITLASVYGMNDGPLANGTTYAMTTVHRLLSDLTPLLDCNRQLRRVVLAGNLNVSPQIRWPDTKHHRILLERLEAFGLMSGLGDWKNSEYVRTHRPKNKEGTTPWQDDWVFHSTLLRLVSCEPDHSDDAWALSDHCPVIAEFEV